MRDYLLRCNGEVSLSPETLRFLGFKLLPAGADGNCFYQAAADQVEGENAVSLRVRMHKAGLELIKAHEEGLSFHWEIFDFEWLKHQIEGHFILRHVSYDSDRVEPSFPFWGTQKHVPLLAYTLGRTAVIYGYQHNGQYSQVASFGYGSNGKPLNLEEISLEDEVIYLVCTDYGEGGHFDGLKRVEEVKAETSEY